MDKATEREFERVYLKGRREGIQLRNRGQIFLWGMIAGVLVEAAAVSVSLVIFL